MEDKDEDACCLKLFKAFNCDQKTKPNVGGTFSSRSCCWDQQHGRRSEVMKRWSARRLLVFKGQKEGGVFSGTRSWTEEPFTHSSFHSDWRSPQVPFTSVVTTSTITSQETCCFSWTRM